jgi:murein DD-endopeptidase MepM/ murein hydrolase activator NlpD
MPTALNRALPCAGGKEPRIPYRPRAVRGLGRIPRWTPGIVFLLVLLTAGAATASGQVELPSGPAAEGQSAAPAPPAAPAPAASAPQVGTRSVAVRLRVGSRGAAVKDLQRELRRRGLRVAVDGAFGPQTKRAVTLIQKRFRMRVTGIADARLLKRLGLPTRTVAAAPATPATPVVPPGTSPYLKLFPVAGEHTYFDDYGAPRGSGVHQGIDIMADRNTPVVAVDDGAISKLSRVETGLGGIYVWLRRADGVQYYYAHLQSVAEGLDVGSRITVGQVLGGVGNTGDARRAPTHMHFEIRNEWTPINPYPHLQAVDPTARVASRARA